MDTIDVFQLQVEPKYIKYLALDGAYKDVMHNIKKFMLIRLVPLGSHYNPW